MQEYAGTSTSTWLHEVKNQSAIRAARLISLLQFSIFVLLRSTSQPIDCFPTDKVFLSLLPRQASPYILSLETSINFALILFSMSHLGIIAIFISFASLSVAFDMENPLQYRQDNNTSTTILPPSVLLSSSASVSLTSQSTSIQTTDSTTSTSSDTLTTALPGAARTSSTTSTTQAQSRSSAETESSTSKYGPSHIASSSRTPTGSVTQSFVTTIISTSGSVTLSITSTSSQVVAAALASATSSANPGINGGDGGSGSSGLSTKTKSVVGGVVGGVGGAILLGGLAIVFWRVWGKSRRSRSADHDLVEPQPGAEKTSSVSGHSPFVSQPCSMMHLKTSYQWLQRSTLDQYHNPGPVNTASNF